ncbi:MAG: hypothetical protein IKU02_04680 [Bacteroidaceae bacterium]|nr:hypothetical protein [Bacteroidaceae bacterium]
MKKLILSLLTLFATTAIWAETALFVHLESGEVVEISFAEKPVVTYNESRLVISVENASVSFPLENMQKFTFGEVDEDVTRIVAPTNATPQPTYIFGIDGKLMCTYKPGENGSTSASLEGLPAGTYVIKNGNVSYKYLKR